MIGWEQTDGGLRAAGPERRTVPVRTPDWCSERTDRDIAVGTTTELSLPRAPATLQSEGTDVPRSVGDGPRELVVETPLPMTVRFDGPASIARGDRLRISFPERRRVTLVLDAPASDAPETVRAPPTAEGIAAAVTAAGATPTTLGPERSKPDHRPHPPQFRFEADTRLPDPSPATDVEVVVPELDSLFQAAPLAYYAGARVVVGTGEPRVTTPKGFDYPLGNGAKRAPDLYKRVLWADALVREECERAERAGITDAATEPMGRRIARYVEADLDAVELPTWPLAAYVEASVERAPTLPHLFARGAAVHAPETQPLSGKALVERSLDSFYRSAPTPEPVDVCEPVLAPSELHCWHAPETPIDVYEGRLAAYESRLRRDGPSRPLRVQVVCNEDRMREEGEDAVGAYRGLGPDLDVRHSRNLTREELRSLFREPLDLLHFVGHCEPDGLRCADGTLAAADVGRVGVRTFLLNACGSYREGVDLVSAGAVAGAVTYRQVLDDQAARVGTTFARLLADGFSVARGLDLARRRVMMGTDYAVVGDGTHSVARPATAPVVAEVAPVDGGYEVTVSAARDGEVGGRYLPPFDDAEPRLVGDDAVRTLDREELRALCERRSIPTVFDGDFRWSERLASELDS